MKIIFLYTRHWTTAVGPLKWFGQNCTTELPNIQQECTRVLQIKIVLLCKYFLQGSWWKCWRFFWISFVSFGLRCSTINYRRRRQTQQFRKPNNCLRRGRCIYLHLPRQEFSLKYNSCHGGWSPLSPWQLYTGRHKAFFLWVVLSGSLSTRVLEMRTATGREHFSCQDRIVSQIFILLISDGEKILSNVNVVVWGQHKSENSSLPVAVGASETLVLKLPIDGGREGTSRYISEIPQTSSFSPSAAHFFFQDVTLT